MCLLPKRVLTGVRQVKVRSAGRQHPGVDARNDVGLIHDVVHHVVIRSQLALHRIEMLTE